MANTWTLGNLRRLREDLHLEGAPDQNRQLHGPLEGGTCDGGRQGRTCDRRSSGGRPGGDDFRQGSFSDSVRVGQGHHNPLAGSGPARAGSGQSVEGARERGGGRKTGHHPLIEHHSPGEGERERRNPPEPPPPLTTAPRRQSDSDAAPGCAWSVSSPDSPVLIL